MASLNKVLLDVLGEKLPATRLATDGSTLKRYMVIGVIYAPDKKAAKERANNYLETIKVI